MPPPHIDKQNILFLRIAPPPLKSEGMAIQTQKKQNSLNMKVLSIKLKQQKLNPDVAFSIQQQN